MMLKAGSRAGMKPCKVVPGRRLQANAVSGQYNHIVPNFDYINAVLESFPEEGVANPDEARALFSHGDYTILDIRNTAEVDRYGTIPKRARNGGRTMYIPFELADKYFEDDQVVVETFPNPDFLDDVEWEFPDKETKLIIMDFDGRTNAMEALDMLFDAGYENIVGLQGGYKAWFKTWDNNLKRRNLGEYQEHSWGEGETSCGIHASGAGFENQDPTSATFWNTF